MRALSKLSLLKERRERIISHLLNIRFIHNAASVFIEQVLFPLLIAAMVAVVEFLVCPLSFLALPFFWVSPSQPLLPASYLESKMFDVTMHAGRLCCFCGGNSIFMFLGLGYLFIYLFCLSNAWFSVSVCCLSPHWAERERLNILFDGLEPERFWIIHSRLLMWLSAAGVSYAPDSGFLLVTESPQTLEFYS